MRFIGATALMVLSFAAPVCAEPATAERDRAQLKQHVAELIEQLGDDQYAVRRRAEDELIRLGPEAFDQLKVAEEHSDLEISERAAYIVQRMRVEWVRAEDPPEVRRTLSRYGDLPETEKTERIARLASLKDGQGVSALCRIARLEPSPLVARRAALAVLNRKTTGERPQLDAEALAQELGSSNRAPVQWIQLYLAEAANPKNALDEWNAAIDAETALLREKSAETKLEIVQGLLERRLELCHELKLLDETTDALVRIIELPADDAPASDDPFSYTGRTAGGFSAAVGWALGWIIEHKRWDVLDQIEERYRDKIHADRGLVYRLAAAMARAGRAPRAEKLADEAFKMEPKERSERVTTGVMLATLGLVDWAEREYRLAIKELPATDRYSLYARRELATWLHDREDHLAAAELLGELFDVIEKDRAAEQKLHQQFEGRGLIRQLSSRRHHYLACHYKAEGQHDKEREALEKALSLERENPDILIAMYRMEGTDDEFRQRTRARIRDLSQEMLIQVEQSPDDPSGYNQWAWLIANTEGDFGKAVEFSRRSLELAADEPSFLDTLGRCYYAAGDLENAVKTQRRAVELAPHYQVMRRQLAQFERELAAKRGGN